MEDYLTKNVFRIMAYVVIFAKATNVNILTNVKCRERTLVELRDIFINKMFDYKYSHIEIARALGKSRTHIYDSLERHALRYKIEENYRNQTDKIYERWQKLI